MSVKTSVLAMSVLLSIAAATAVSNAQNAAISERLEIGTRITTFVFQDKKSSFLGTINELDEDQNYAPTKLFVVYKFLPWLAGELAWDEIRAETSTSAGRSDGTYTFSGPVALVYWRHPNATIVTPYAGLGLAFLSGKFEHEGWWHYGYVSPEQYAEFNYLNVYHNNKKRTMTIDDVTGLVVAGGASIQVREHAALDLHLRYTSMDSTASYYIYDYLGGSGELSFSNFEVGIGVKYTF